VQDNAFRKDTPRRHRACSRLTLPPATRAGDPQSDEDAMRKTLTFAFLTLVVTAAAHAQQSSPAALEPGRRAIEIALPEGGGTQVGLWWVRSPQTQLGINGAFQYGQSEIAGGRSISRWQFLVGPALKRHVAVSGPIVPHWRAAAMIGASGGDQQSEARHINLAVGFGVDWFPWDRVSIGGHMGVQAGHARNTATLPTGQEHTFSSTAIGTFRSGLTLQLYF
jgi:hypothetical protein